MAYSKLWWLGNAAFGVDFGFELTSVKNEEGSVQYHFLQFGIAEVRMTDNEQQELVAVFLTLSLLFFSIKMGWQGYE